MASVNKVILIGNLGKDPETRYSASGTAFTNFSIATSRKYKKDGDSEYTEETEWHNITTFGRTAEVAGEYLRKGKPVYIEGRLRTRKWQDKDGNDRYTTEVVAEHIQFLGSRDDGERQERPRRAQSTSSEPKPSKHQKVDDMDDDIPF